MGLMDESYLNKMSLEVDIEKSFANRLDTTKDHVASNIHK